MASKAGELRKAIGSHHTATSAESWDGPANVARLAADKPAEYYRGAYAWQDPEADPKTKGAYKFPHHFIGADGAIGAASTKAAIAGIAALNGARGGADIPAEDRAGVWKHLAAHLKDAGLEPPELQRGAGLPGLERRYIAASEIRLDPGTGEAPTIIGYPARFDVLSEPIGFFAQYREKIRPGAFKKTIGESDIRALWNHDPNYVLGRVKAGTLELEEDTIGLRFRARPPSAQWARDLVESIRRGDVDQGSFGFETIRDEWHVSETGEVTRELVEVKLFDVGPVTFPAYPQTTIATRELAGIGVDVATFAEAFARAQAGAAFDSGARELEILSSVRAALDALAPRRAATPPDRPAGAAPVGPLDLYRRRLELAGKA